MAHSQGSIDTTPIPPPDGIRDAGATWEEHVWRPSQQLQAELHKDFTLTIWSTTDRSGTRRFQPPDWGSFPILAACGGLVIRQATEEMESLVQFRSFQSGFVVVLVVVLSGSVRLT